ncbi:hemolysin family protein [Parvibaculum sp.]|uniref:hemolysin family protein n=1 Tax=Parvibaculum sp. TaxID=2024848 RepID=UPI0034A00F9B
MVYIELLVVLLLIAVNGVLAMSELAVVSSRKVRLEQMAREGSAGARRALLLIDDPSRFLATVQIGITLVGVVAGAFSGATLGLRLGTWLATFPMLADYGPAGGIAVVVVSITYLSLVAGELVPKRIALLSPERVAAAIAPPMQLLSLVAAPAVWVLKVSIDAVLKLLGLGGTRQSTVTEDEVKSLIAEGTRAGVFMPQEREMIEGVLRLADRTVRAIMTPRPDLVWIDRHATAQEISETVRTHRFSRLLVCDGSVDEAIGVVHVKDILPAALEGGTLELDRFLAPAIVVPDRKEVLRLLDRFKRDKVHFAVVVDEYGSTQGIVTLTDILESIAGELPKRGEEQEKMMERRADGSWLVDGAMPVDEFAVRIDAGAIGGDFQTVAGLALLQFGHLPQTGEAFTFKGHRYEVVDMDGRRIDKILVTPVRDDTGEGAV